MSEPNENEAWSKCPCCGALTICQEGDNAPARYYFLSRGEVRRLQQWDEKHCAERHNGEEPYAGAIGGRITITFTNTSIGRITHAVCGLCDVKECLTDFDDW